MAGTERMMQTVARELPRHGFDVEVVIPQHPGVRDLLDWFQRFGASATASEELANLSLGGWRAVPAFAQYLRRKGAALVNLHSPGHHIPLLELVSGRLAALPVVTSIHGYDATGRSTRIQRWRNRIVGSPLNGAVVVMNRIVKAQQKANGIAEKKLSLIYNAVATPPEGLTRAAARRQLNICEQSYVIVSFCRLVRDKGVDVLIDAVEQLPEDLLRRAKVFVGGTGPELEYLQSKINQRARDVIHLLGHVPDPSEYYTAADVFVLPSRHEPFGLVFLEAAQHGVASIGTIAGGIPEVVDHGETGLLVEPENPSQLAEAILLLSQDPELRERLGANARQRVRARFAVDALAQNYAALFRRVLADRSI
jgi:glycosyltransferase involved in cell wall biosynthesis